MMMKMVSKIVISLVVLLSVLQNSDGRLQEYFCVASHKVPVEVVANALNWACENGADCGPIGGQGSCYEPNTIIDHASYAFNSYYHNMKYNGGICSFNGAAVISANDPSHDSCTYEGTI